MSLDADALRWFDDFMELPAAERDARLAELAQTNPPLHKRLQVMLASLDDAEASQLLRQPAIGVSAGAAAGAPATHQAGQRIAAWRLVRCIGKGGMAEVWLAEPIEGRLQRPAAIKLPLHLEGQWAERFARERDVLVSLDHPHIARLYDAGGDAQGQAFLALELVQGESLTEFASRQQLGLPARLGLAQQVLQALAHAHRRLVVHRDLKPSNVMVTPEGQVKLLDFGIAKLLGPQAGAAALTHDLTQLLTPRYAAPEQVAGGAITTATDLYAFGVLLYELLTGRLPYGGPDTTLQQALHAVVYEQPAKPGLTPDLDAVLMKCLAKEPEARYASAEQLLDDLTAVLAHRPVSARRISVWTRGRLWVRRNRWLATTALLGSVFTLAGVGVASHQWLEARAQAARGDAVRRFINNMMSEAEPSGGRTEVSAADLLAAAVRQARQSFDEAPHTRAEILGELGRVQIRLQQWADAEATLTDALALFDAHAPVSDPLANRARAYLATLLAAQGGDALSRAQALAQQVLRDCPLPDAECALSQGSARYALWRVSAWRDDASEGLAQARAMVAASRLAGASYVSQRIDALETLAAAALYAGQLAESRQALVDAEQVGRAIEIKNANRHRLRWLGLVLDGYAGEPAAAAEQLLAMADSSGSAVERARVLNAASLQLQLAGRADRALSPALLPALSGAGPIQAATRLSQAQAHAMLGQWPASEAALREAEAMVTPSSLAPSSPLAQRLRRHRALVDAQQGRFDTALAAVATAAELEQPVDAARGLAVRACVLLQRGEREPAAAALRAAQARLPAGAQSLQLRMALMQAWLSGDPAATSSALAALRATLAPDSEWQRVAPASCLMLGL